MAYINHVLKRFSMNNCLAGDAPIVNGDNSLNTKALKMKLRNRQRKKFLIL